MRTKKTAVIAAAAATVIGLVLAPAAGAQGLKQTPFDDGTGSVGLPAGWRLGGAYHGQVQCLGPNGAATVFGFPWTVLRPDSSVAQLPGAATTPVADPRDIAGAIRQILAKKTGGTLRGVRGTRAAGPNGAPAYLLFYEHDQDGKRYAAYGYFAALDYGPGQPVWQLYSSAVVAPKAQFAQMLPTMLRIWKSWRPNGQPPREGSASAIFDKAMEKHRLSYDEIQRQFREQL